MFNLPNITKSSFSKIGLFAIPLIMLMVAMNAFFPKEHPEDYSSFVIAFEFVKTPEQVEQLFAFLTPAENIANSLSVEEKIAGLNIGNYFDFGFMLCYALFLFLFFKKAATHYNIKWLKLGMPLAVLALFCDIGENIHLLNIANAYPSAEKMSGFLRALPFFVWTKWLALSVVLGLGAFAFLMGKELITKLLAFVLVLPLILGITALITQASFMIDGFTGSIFVGIGILVASCFWLK